MQIRKATSDDIWIIQALSKQVWPHTFADILSEKQIAYMMDMMYSTEAIERQLSELSHQYLLISEEEEYLGYLAYELNYKDRDQTKIHKIYVLPSTQGRGVGKLLIDRVAKEHHNKSIALNVNRNNKAIGFYERLGFAIVGSEDIDIGNGFLMEDYVMMKPLTDL